MEIDSDSAMLNGRSKLSASNVESTGKMNTSAAFSSSDTSTSPSNPSLCEECEDRRAVWDCSVGCGGIFCDVCFHALHRKGKRALHKPERKAVACTSAGKLSGGNRKGGGGAMVSGWIGPRLPSRSVVNPDMYDR